MPVNNTKQELHSQDVRSTLVPEHRHHHGQDSTMEVTRPRSTSTSWSCAPPRTLQFGHQHLIARVPLSYHKILQSIIITYQKFSSRRSPTSLTLTRRENSLKHILQEGYEQCLQELCTCQTTTSKMPSASRGTSQSRAHIVYLCQLKRQQVERSDWDIMDPNDVRDLGAKSRESLHSLQQCVNIASCTSRPEKRIYNIKINNKQRRSDAIAMISQQDDIEEEATLHGPHQPHHLCQAQVSDLARRRTARSTTSHGFVRKRSKNCSKEERRADINVTSESCPTLLLGRRIT